jgi:hypothetical protein
VPNPPPADQNLDDARTSLARATSSVLDEMQSGAVFEAIGIEVAPAQLLEASDDVLHVVSP